MTGGVVVTTVGLGRGGGVGEPFVDGGEGGKSGWRGNREWALGGEGEVAECFDGGIGEGGEGAPFLRGAGGGGEGARSLGWAADAEERPEGWEHPMVVGGRTRGSSDCSV